MLHMYTNILHTPIIMTHTLSLSVRYDVHREVQEVVREQARQFSIAREDTAELLQRLSQQMADLLRYVSQ
jgi:hypothetical protein